MTELSGAVHIPHGSDSPGEIPRRRPTGSLGQVSVGIDQSGNNPAAGDIYLVDAAGKLESGARSDGFDLTATHQYRGIGQGRSAGSIDQGGAYQRYTVLRGGLASREDQAAGNYAKDEAFNADHWMSDHEGSSSLQICAP